MEKHPLVTACAVAMATMLGLAGTSTAHAELSYTYVEGSYFDIDIDDSDADGDGFGIAGSAAITDLFHLFGNYATADLDGPGGGDLDFDTWELGAGVNLTMAENLDFVGRLSYLNVEVDVPGFGGGDEDGYGLYGGLRGRVLESIELEGGIAYADFDNSGDDTALALAGRYYFNDQVALGLSTEIGDDVTVWGINLRWELPASP